MYMLYLVCLKAAADGTIIGAIAWVPDGTSEMASAVISTDKASGMIHNACDCSEQKPLKSFYSRISSNCRTNNLVALKANYFWPTTLARETSSRWELLVGNKILLFPGLDIDSC